VRHGLQAHLRLASPALFALVDDFTGEVLAKVDALKSERAPASNSSTTSELEDGQDGGGGEGVAWARLLGEHAFGLPTCAAPKVLSDVAEALVGAVWLDSGGSLAAAWGAAARLLRPLPPLGGGVPIHPLRRLRVRCCIVYCIARETSVLHFIIIPSTALPRVVQELAAKAGVALAFEEVEPAADGFQAAGGGGVAVRITGDGEVLGQGCNAANRAAASRLAAQAALGAWDVWARGRGK
jgi:hypothetical protein